MWFCDLEKVSISALNRARITLLYGINWGRCMKFPECIDFFFHREWVLGPFFRSSFSTLLGSYFQSRCMPPTGLVVANLFDRRLDGRAASGPCPKITGLPVVAQGTAWVLIVVNHRLEGTPWRSPGPSEVSVSCIPSNDAYACRCPPKPQAHCPSSQVTPVSTTSYPSVQGENTKKGGKKNQAQ